MATVMKAPKGTEVVHFKDVSYHVNEEGTVTAEDRHVDELSDLGFKVDKKAGTDSKPSADNKPTE